MKLQPQERWGPGLREGNTGEHTQKLPEEKVLFPLHTGVLPGWVEAVNRTKGPGIELT